MQLSYPLIPRSCLNNQHLARPDDVSYICNFVTLHCEHCPAYKDIDDREFKRLTMLAPKKSILFSLP